MPLTFRALFPLSLSGVLVLLGCWWYTLRKKGCLVVQEKEEGPSQALPPSPCESSNGVLQKGPAASSGPRAAGEMSAEQEDSAAVSARCQSLPGGSPVCPRARLSAELNSSGTENSVNQSMDKSAQQQEPPASRAPDATHSSAFAGGVRPEPEGEVAQVKMSVPFAEGPQTDAVKDEGFSFTESPASTPSCLRAMAASRSELPSGPARHVGPERRGLAEDSGERGASPNEEEGRLATGLVEEVVSAAAQAVLVTGTAKGAGRGREEAGDSSEQEGSPVPQVGGGRCAARGRGQTQSDGPPRVLREASSSSTALNSSCSSPAVSGSREHDVGSTAAAEEESDRPALAATKSKARSSSPAAAQAGADSGFSTCPPEDGAAGEDPVHTGGLSSAVPEDEGDSKTSRGTRSGEASGNRAPIAGEEDANLSEESDVNGVHGSDGEIQDSSSLPSQSLTVWDIEVPKHLVGRLIGKQGKYVSFLKQNSGAKIYVSTLPYTQEFQICHVEGSQEQVDRALSLIGRKFKELDLTNRCCPPQPSSPLPSLPVSSWLLLPQGVEVEVTVARVETANYLFVQQHTHPTYHALRSLNQQMLLCYSLPGCPGLPTPVEAGVICAAPTAEGGWWRAQVIKYYSATSEVQIRYVDYGGYVTVLVDTLRQIRSDFVALPFQGAEVMLENIAPLQGEEEFSLEAKSAVEDLTKGVALLTQVTGYHSGLPTVQMWRMEGEELMSVTRALVDRGLCTWADGH